MSRPPSLNDFIEDELLRAPMVFDAVIDAVLSERRRHGDSAADRVLQHHRMPLVGAVLAGLRRACLAEAAPGAAPTKARPSATGAELSLIGEDDVAVDIELARCVAALRAAAESELRELQTYTSALVGDANVSRDTNPFRPELLVRALWDAVATLPMPRAALARLMRDACVPLAEAQRKAYAGAIARLQGQGVEPAAYRTIIVPGSTAWGHEVSRPLPPAQMTTLAASLPPSTVPGGLPAPPPAAAPAAAGAAAPTTLPDAQSIELLSRLFDAIQNAHGLDAEVVALLQRLQPSALRVALHDPEVLSSYDHAVWRFMDLMAYQLSVCPTKHRARMLTLVRNLVDQIAHGQARDASRFAWAIDWLGSHHRHATQRLVGEAEAEIARLQRSLQPEAMVTTSAMPLDLGTLDTVPAELMDSSLPTGMPAAAGASVGTGDAQTGDHFRVYLQGEWRLLQLLWQDPGQTLWLLHEPHPMRHWALRSDAVQRLQQAGLARPMRVRSLVRRAAAEVLRGL